MGRSKLVPIFLISEGARLRINLLMGSWIPILRNVDLILSLDSLILASGSPIISIQGSALLLSASTETRKLSNQMFENVFMVFICVFV